MRRTYLRPDAQAVDRWLNRFRLFPWRPSAVEVDLLAGRLAVRRRVQLWSVPAFILAVVLALHAIEELPSELAGRSGRLVGVLPLLLAELVVTATVYASAAGVRRGDRRISLSLPYRAARPVAASLPTVLGRASVAGLTLAAVTDIVMVTVIFVQRVDLKATIFLAACLFAWACAVVGVIQAASRPAIAADSLTVAFDERLRSSAAVRACVPIVLVTYSFSLLDGNSPHFGMYWLDSVIPVFVALMINYGQPASRWRKPYAPYTPMISKLRPGR
jgi:hypothetical protein